MPKTSEALRKAIDKYQKEKVDELKVRVPKGHKEILQAHAESQGESLNGFINRAANETMQINVKKVAKEQN